MKDKAMTVNIKKLTINQRIELAWVLYSMAAPEYGNQIHRLDDVLMQNSLSQPTLDEFSDAVSGVYCCGLFDLGPTLHFSENFEVKGYQQRAMYVDLSGNTVDLTQHAKKQHMELTDAEDIVIRFRNGTKTGQQLIDEDNQEGMQQMQTMFTSADHNLAFSRRRP